MESKLQELTKNLGTALEALVSESEKQNDMVLLEKLGLENWNEGYLNLSVFQLLKESYRQDPLLNLDLSPSQRIIGHIMFYGDQHGQTIWSQRELRELTGFTNKGIRTMLQDMAQKGYITRGLKAATWESKFSWK